MKELQRQAEFLPWMEAWAGGEGNVQESPVQRQQVKFYSWVRMSKEMGQKGKRKGPRTGKLRTSHNSAGGEEYTWNNPAESTVRVSDLPQKNGEYEAEGGSDVS